MMAAGHGFKWWNVLHNNYLDANPHFAAATVGLGVLAFGTYFYQNKLKKRVNNLDLNNLQDEALIPPEKFGLSAVFDSIGGFVHDTVRDIIGHGYQKHLPLLIFTFFWVFLNNLLGAVPGLGSATDNINSTLSIALVIFLYYNFLGFKEHGFAYLDQFCGHLVGTQKGIMLLILAPLIPLMFVIEIISHSVRPLTLGIRLMANISADHQIYATVFQMVDTLSNSLAQSFGFFGAVVGKTLLAILPTPIVVLGLLVAGIQAFVFTLLSAIYIGLATAHEDH